MLLTRPFAMLSMPSFEFHLPPCTEGFLIHLSPLWQLSLWQLPLFPSVAQFPCIRQNWVHTHNVHGHCSYRTPILQWNVRWLNDYHELILSWKYAKKLNPHTFNSIQRPVNMFAQDISNICLRYIFLMTIPMFGNTRYAIIVYLMLMKRHIIYTCYIQFSTVELFWCLRERSNWSM